MLLFVVGALTTATPTYPDIDFAMTARDLVTRAMQDRKVIALGVTPKSKELDYGIQTLNLIFKSWAAKGLTLWADEDGAATVTAGSADVTLTPRPIDVHDVSLVLSATNERQLARWEKSEYSSLPNKASIGNPTIYTPVYTTTGMSIKVWPVPSADMMIAYSYARVIATVTQPSDYVDVPQMWTETVIKILAGKLDTFGGDPQHVANIKAEAAMLERQMFDHDRPASYFIGVDC
jgi:Tfp pilus assembly protein PilV